MTTITSPLNPAATQRVYTTLGKNICYILGETNDLLYFDRLRSELHLKPGCKELIETYETSLAKIKQQVFIHHEKLKREIEKWQGEYFCIHNCREPTLKNYKENAKVFEKYKKFTRAKKLLKHWNITVI